MHWDFQAPPHMLKKCMERETQKGNETVWKSIHRAETLQLLTSQVLQLLTEKNNIAELGHTWLLNRIICFLSWLGIFYITDSSERLQRKKDV